MSATLLASLLLQVSQPATAPQRPPPATTDMPGWSRAPSPADMTRVYPQEALRANMAGSATLECTIGPTGELVDCVAGDETPPQAGFGAAALAVAARFQMATQSPSGATTAGRTVRFPVSWLNPAKSEAPPIVIYDDSGRAGSVGFNCRVRDGRSLDNCVVVDAKPRGTNLFGLAGEAVLRAKAPARSAPWSRILVVVEVKAR